MLPWNLTCLKFDGVISIWWIWILSKIFLLKIEVVGLDSVISKCWPTGYSDSTATVRVFSEPSGMLHQWVWAGANAPSDDGAWTDLGNPRPDGLLDVLWLYEFMILSEPWPLVGEIWASPKGKSCSYTDHTANDTGRRMPQVTSFSQLLQTSLQRCVKCFSLGSCTLRHIFTVAFVSWHCIVGTHLLYIPFNSGEIYEHWKCWHQCLQHCSQPHSRNLINTQMNKWMNKLLKETTQ